MASLLAQAVKGAQGEVLAEQGALQRLRKLRQLAGVLAAELGVAAGLAPYGLRSLRVKTSVPVAGSAAAGASPYGVVLFPAVPYGPKPRQLIDIYVPSHVYEQLQHEQQEQHEQQPGCQQEQQKQKQGLLPVVFFVHGGIWATGERWHFGPMAVSLAQAGAVVAVASYSLYPHALASAMAGEVLAALTWTSQEVARYGGDAAQLSVVGHSAGGHLAALALMMLARQRRQALEAAAAAAGGQPGGSSRQQQQQQQEQQQDKRSQGQAASSHSLQQQQQRTHQQEQPSAGVHEPQLQQAPQQQQQSRHQWRPLWYLPDPLALPQPLLFVGMSAVYDVGLHFEFESKRGVAGISTMARACGGAAMFGAVSPAVLLKQAAADGREAAGSAAATLQPRRCGNQQQLLQPVQWPQLPAGAAAAAAASYHFEPAQLGRQSQQRFTTPGVGSSAVTPDSAGYQPQQPLLHGEVIPIRTGMQAPRTDISSSSSSSSSSLALALAAPTSETETPSRAATNSSQGGNDTSFCDAATLLRGFSLADAARLPPFVLMSSCGDHMVPWHEAADMAAALQACRVPAKHLIYDRYLHNDFVLDWSPALMDENGAGRVEAAGVAAEQALAAPSAAAAAVAGGGVAEVSRAPASGNRTACSMPAFAQDLISIVTGRVQLQFGCCDAAAEQRTDTGGGANAVAATAESGSGFGMGRWFALQPHSRL